MHKQHRIQFPAFGANNVSQDEAQNKRKIRFQDYDEIFKAG